MNSNDSAKDKVIIAGSILKELKRQIQRILDDYNKMESFMKRLKSTVSLEATDKLIIESVYREYDDHVENLKALIDEFETMSSDYTDDMSLIIEVAEPVLHNSLSFLVSIPEKLSKTTIGKDIPFDISKVDSLFMRAPPQ